MPWKHVLRDTALLLVSVCAWSADAAMRDAGGWTASLVGATAAALAALCGYLAHEWGHLAGARAGRSIVHRPDSVRSVFLFRFDVERNGRGQFLAMSCGGFLATAGVVAAYLSWLPLDALSGRLALGLTGLGVLATAVLELPPAWRVLRGAPLPRGAAYVSSPGRGPARA